MHGKFAAASEGFNDVMNKEILKEVQRWNYLQPRLDKVATDLREEFKLQILEKARDEAQETVALVAKYIQQTVPSLRR